MHPDTELRFINDEIGFGVFATRLIPKGTITWVLDSLDRVIPEEEVQSLGELYRGSIDKYCFRNQHGEYILCWDYSRYVNHSFKPSCFTTPYDFEIAIRDIHPGEELTDDYGYLNIDEPFEPFEEGTERKVVYPDDLLRYGKEWDKIILDVLPSTMKVNQLLKPLISMKTWDEVVKVTEGKMEMRSLTSNFFWRPGI